MIQIKLTEAEYNYLVKNSKVNDDDVVKRETKITIELAEDYILDLHDWVGENLQRNGFNENYEVNQEGKILENLIDTLNI